MPRRSFARVSSLLLVAMVPLSLALAAEPEVKLTPIKYDDFVKTIASNKKAKLTVVDVWATWCGPCKKNFPHLVEMHRKYADKGLEAVSVSVDEHERANKVSEARAFLVEKKATFRNYILTDSMDEAFEKLNISAIPAVFLFGPDGKEIKRYTLDDVDNLFTYEQVEEAVQAYLDGKPIPETKKKKAEAATPAKK